MPWACERQHDRQGSVGARLPGLLRKPAHRKHADPTVSGAHCDGHTVV